MMKNKQSMELLLEIKTSNKDMKQVVESTVKSMDSLSAGITKNLEQVTKAFGSSMMGVTNQTDAAFKDIAKTLGMITDLLAQIQDKPRAARNAVDSSKLNTSVKLKGIEGVQKGILGRAQTSYRQAVGLEGYTGATQVMEKFAAMNSLLSTKIKGAGNLKDDLGAAQAMRSFTKLDREVGRLFIGSDFTKALGKAGNAASQAQKRATQALVAQVKTAMGTGDDIFDGMARMALTGTSDTDMSQWSKNIKKLGKDELRKMGKTISPNRYAKEYAKTLKMTMDEIQSTGTAADMQKFFDRYSIKMPAEPAGEMSSSQRKAYNQQRNAAIYKGAQLQSSLRVENEYRTFGEQALYSRANSAIMRMPDMQEFEAAGPQQVRTGIRGLFDKIGGALKKSEKTVAERSDGAEQALMRGFDAFGYRMITISYMLSNTNMMLNNTINGLMAAGVSRQRSMGKIQPILTGGVSGSGAELTPYRKEMESIAATTGIGFEELAQSMYDTASAFPNVENKMDALRVTAKLTSVGFGGTTASMEGLIAVAKTYNRDLETDSQAFSAAMETLGDLSVAAANVGTLEVSELGDAMQTMAPTAANLGITIRELYASIASTAGVIGNTSEAANKLKQLFTAFNSPNKKMQELYASEGVANGQSFIKKFGGIQGAMSAVDKYVGPAQNYKGLTGRSQAQEAIFGLKNADELFSAFTNMTSTLLELETAQRKATKGVAYWSTEYAGAMERYKTIQAEVGEAMLPFKVGILEMKNSMLSFALSIPGVNRVVPSLVQVIALVSGAVAPLLGFIGSVALASRAMTQMSAEVMAEKAQAMYLKNIEKLPDFMKAGPSGLNIKNVGGKSISTFGDLDSHGSVIVNGNQGRVEGFNTGGAMALIGKIGLVITAITILVAAINAVSTWLKDSARKKVSSVMDSPAVSLARATMNEDAANAIKKRELAYTREESIAANKTIGDLSRSYDAKRTQINSGRMRIEDTLASSSSSQMLSGAVFKNLLAEIMNGNFGVAAQAIANDKNVQEGGISKYEWAEMAKAMGESSADITAMIDAMLGSRQIRSKEVVDAENEDALGKSMMDKMREMFSNIILSGKRDTKSFNWEQFGSDAIKTIADAERDRVIADGGSVVASIAAWKSANSAWDVLFENFKNADWSEEFKNAIAKEGVTSASTAGLSEVGPITGELRAVQRAISEEAENIARFGDDLSVSTLVSDALEVLESTVSKTSKSAIALDNNLAGLGSQIEIFRTMAFSKGLENEDNLARRGIRSASGTFDIPWMEAGAKSKLMSSLSANASPKAIEEALKGLVGKSAKYSRISKNGISSIASMAGDADVLDALGKLLDDQGDIASVAQALSATGATIGEGASKMSAAAYFLSGASSMTEETFKKLVYNFDLTTPADAALYTDLIRGFDVFAIAAKTAADALQDDKNSFLRPGQQSAIGLRKQAADLRGQYTVGSEFYDPSVAGSSDAIQSINALAKRLETRATWKDWSSGTEGNPLTAYTDSGLLMDSGSAMASGIWDKLLRPLVDEVPKAIAAGNDKLQTWARSDKTQLRRDGSTYKEAGQTKYKQETVWNGMALMLDSVKNGLSNAADYFFKRDEITQSQNKDGSSQFTAQTGFAQTLGNVKDFFFKKEDEDGDGEETTKFGDFLGKAGQVFGLLLNIVMSVISKSKAFETLMQGVNVIFGRMMLVIEPVLEQALVPLLGILAIMGQLLGTMLVPIIVALMPIVIALANLFVTVYNLLRPVFELILDIFVAVAVTVENVVNALNAALSYITFWDKSDDGARNFKWKDAFKQFGTTELQGIVQGQIQAEGASVLAETGSYSSANGSSADTAKAPDQYFNFYIGSDAITDVNGGKIVSVEYILDQFQARLAQTATMQA